MIVDTYHCLVCNNDVASVLDKCLITERNELNELQMVVRRKVPICPSCLVKVDYNDNQDPFA